MFSRFIFWPWFAGLIVFIIGVVAARRDLRAARGLHKLVVLGPILVAAPLATFGAEHLVAAQFVAQMVPAWIPGHLFWAYFVGFALLAAGLSFALGRSVRLSALLLGTMIFLFVLTIHLPKVLSNPHDRVSWAVLLRDAAFGGGAWALGSRWLERRRNGWASRLILIGRLCAGSAAVSFGVEYFMLPTIAPGVPLAKLTPGWVPIPFFWAYVTGAVLLVGGVALLAGKRVESAAIAIGFVMLVVTVFLYVPIFAMAKPAELTEALNYVADTLMFGGTALLLAGATSEQELPVRMRSAS